MNQKQSQTSTPPNLLAGLDIGTTKVCMVVALVEGNELEIIGSGVSPTCGVKKRNYSQSRCFLSSIVFVVVVWNALLLWVRVTVTLLSPGSLPLYEGNEKVSRATGSINDRILR